jgi:hypothetical protein
MERTATLTRVNGYSLSVICGKLRSRLDFIQVPGLPTAIRVFALTHSRRIVVQR